MVCTYFAEPSVQKRREAMATAGWSPEDIKNLENEVELARRKAEAASYAAGDTKAEQQRKIERAEKSALKVAHDREHAKLEAMSKDIEKMRAFKGAFPGHHYDEEASERTDEILAGVTYHDWMKGKK